MQICLRFLVLNMPGVWSSTFMTLTFADRLFSREQTAFPREANTSVSCFLRCRFQMYEALTDSQVVYETSSVQRCWLKDPETRNNSKDGTGLFIWRVVINCAIPARFPNLKIGTNRGV
eukprot:GHVN01078375.1.p1 GENE.GHVN01078375.1~~GHVN01078375.1.p1  ORF type:complete len:118 (+),score=1.58 GHVN01078375.1:647-1000(+)